ncbi:unnamed protein product, partial [Cyprideis torosa]
MAAGEKGQHQQRRQVGRDLSSPSLSSSDGLPVASPPSNITRKETDKQGKKHRSSSFFGKQTHEGNAWTQGKKTCIASYVSSPGHQPIASLVSSATSLRTTTQSVCDPEAVRKRIQQLRQESVEDEDDDEPSSPKKESPFSRISAPPPASWHTLLASARESYHQRTAQATGQQDDSPLASPRPDEELRRERLRSTIEAMNPALPGIFYEEAFRAWDPVKVAKTWKKDCRTWLWKNRAEAAAVEETNRAFFHFQDSLLQKRKQHVEMNESQDWAESWLREWGNVTSEEEKPGAGLPGQKKGESASRLVLRNRPSPSSYFSEQSAGGPLNESHIGLDIGQNQEELLEPQLIKKRELQS